MIKEGGEQSEDDTPIVRKIAQRNMKWRRFLKNTIERVIAKEKVME